MYGSHGLLYNRKYEYVSLPAYYIKIINVHTADVLAQFSPYNQTNIDIMLYLV